MYDRYKVLECFESNKDFFKHTVNPNIEKYRKGNMRISVFDAEGNALSNTKVKIKQVKHEFKFGANLFMLDELETDEKNRIYKEFFKSIFNMATLPFYWNSIEPEKGKLRYDKNSEKFYRRPPIDLCIEFCKENGIEPREHALAYEHLFPQWLKGLSKEATKKELERRYKEIADRYKDIIPTIEVTNEMLWGHNDCVTELYNELDYIEWCFKMAEKYFPNNQLVINEYTEAFWGGNCRSTDSYYAYIEANILKGARIDAIGSQFHIFESRESELAKSSYLYNPISLYNHMNLYSNLTKNLQVTEITIPAYSNKQDDEEIQAKILEYLYQIWFSHPNMEQIIYWNLVDGYAYVPNPTPEAIRWSQGNMSIGENVYFGGLLRFDLSPKPALLALDNLINKKWHTEFNGELNEAGFSEFRGFYGDYEVEISVGNEVIKKTFTFSKNGKQDINIIV
ncbi:MAG: endo-1,4-beta-xylanase [Clostridia bacterium]|nr:endo-1,4-beta-xylanase [Clostridia bacterium]